MKNLRCALATLAMVGMAWAEQNQSRFVTTTMAEATAKQLTPMGFHFEVAPNRPGIETFPDGQTYLRSRPAPPGGTYRLSVQEYKKIEATQNGLQSWVEAFAHISGLTMTAPQVFGDIRISAEQVPLRASAFVTGESHARTHYCVILLPYDRAADYGAALVMAAGPYSATTANPQAFQSDPGFALPLKTLKISRNAP